MNKNVWGIHMDRSVGLAPIEQGFIGIGWSELGNLSKFTDRDSLKTALKEVQPTSTESSIRTQSSPLFRFINEMKLGDYVVYPSKIDRMVYVGTITSDYYFDENVLDDDYQNRRKIDWLTSNGIPRNTFTQSTLNELGAFITIFRVKQHTSNEIFKHLGLTDAIESEVEVVTDLEEELTENLDDKEFLAKSINETAKTSTEDFIIEQLHSNLNGNPFAD